VAITHLAHKASRSSSSSFFTSTMEKTPSFPPSIQRASLWHILRLRSLGMFGVLALLFLVYQHFNVVQPPPHATSTISRCRSLRMKAGPPKEFHKRLASDRFVYGTKPVLIQRGTIWTGLANGTEIIHGDILLDKGIIKSVGYIRRGTLEAYGSDLVVIDAKNAWITPGIIDIHSHLGDAPLPTLSGAEDYNSLKGTVQPWLRSLDGLNTHDDSYPLSVAGGVTTALILPGSANAIGKST
jgi:hypothetical protein